MPLLVTSVPNLVQGISQQPDNLRYPGQSDEQINAWSTVVEGLVKRPPTEYVKKTENRADTDNDLFTHFVKRDESNKYVVAVSLNGANVSLGVLNTEDGVRIPVSATATAASYLSGITNPREDLKALTVADYTFLVNKKKVVAKSTEEATYSRVPPKEGLIVVKLGDYEKNYSVFINNTLVPYDSTVFPAAHGGHDPASNGGVGAASYQSGAGSTSGYNADTTHIAQDLKDLIESYITVNSTATTQSVQNVGISGGFSLPYAPIRDAATVSPVNINEYSYKIEFTLTQGATGTGARGYIITALDGSVTGSELTQQGTGYDATAASTLELQIYRGQWRFINPMLGTNWMGWELFRTVTAANASDFGYTFPTLGTVVIPNTAGSTYEVDVRESVIRLKSVRYVVHDAVFYSLIKEHTAAASSEPGVGSDWTEYWVEAPASVTAAQAWATGSLYNLSDFGLRTSDGLSDQGLGVVYKEVNNITELPTVCYNNFKVKIIGDAELAQDDYYVRFKTKDGEDFGTGTWVETVGWWNDGSSTGVQEALQNAFDPTTMPITLKPVFGDPTAVPPEDPTKVVSFKLQTPNEDTTEAPRWAARSAGDNYTNPFPSFVGRTINDVFFFKNRLGFLTDSNIIFSEADEYFNFFRTTTQQLLDSAPIDVGLSHTKVAQLQHALPFQEKLMLFSRQSQFVLRGADLLTPKTVSISPVTEYDISDNIDPVALGNYIYFPFKRDTFEGMYEYFVDNNTEVFEANEITAQVPKLIPANITHLVGTASENMIVAKSSTDDYTLFVYKYYWQNKEKIQSAWMKFTYSRKIRGFDFIDSDLLLLTEDTEGLHLEKATMENGLVDDGLTYKLYLDSRIAGDAKDENDINILTVAYNSSAKTTTISGFPYDPVNVEVYTKGGTFKDFTRTTATAGTVSGALGSYVDNGGDFVNHNGVTYYCLQDNGGTGVTEPGVGAEWTQYWKVVDFDVSRPTWVSSEAWENIVTNWESLTTSWDTGATYTGGVVYKCIKDHTSTAATEPGVGADWATYWVASTDFTTYAFWLLGNDYHDDRYFFAGIPYNMLYRFSNQILKQPTERGGRSASDYTFQTIRNASIEYADTGHFTVEVTPRFRDTYKYPYNPALLASISTLNDFTPESGHFRFAVQAQPNEATIEIKSDSALPCKLLAAEFESMVIPRAKRYGS